MTSELELLVERHKVRLDNIDLLRAIAVVMVLLYHYTARFDVDFYGYKGFVPAFRDGYREFISSSLSAASVSG